MNFLKEKVRKYQEKKLKEAYQNLKSYTEIKNQLENNLKSAQPDEIQTLQKDIEKQKNFIQIWEKNIKEIKIVSLKRSTKLTNL